MIQWFSPHQIEAIRLERQVDAMIERDAEAYQRVRQVDKKSYPPQWKPKKKGPGGSKPGVKRGPYKKRPKPEPPVKILTTMATSKYYAANPPEPGKDFSEKLLQPK